MEEFGLAQDVLVDLGRYDSQKHNLPMAIREVSAVLEYEVLPCLESIPELIDAVASGELVEALAPCHLHEYRSLQIPETIAATIPDRCICHSRPFSHVSHTYLWL